MSNVVKVVAHPETGKVFTERGTKGWGSFGVNSTSLEFTGGIVNRRSRTAFISCHKDEFPKLGITLGMELPGIIQRQVSFVPFYAGQEPVLNPTTREEKLIDGNIYYQNFEFISGDGVDVDLELWVENEAPVQVEEKELVDTEGNGIN